MNPATLDDIALHYTEAPACRILTRSALQAINPTFDIPMACFTRSIFTNLFLLCSRLFHAKHEGLSSVLHSQNVMNNRLKDAIVKLFTIRMHEEMWSDTV
jgi:hypothetical protein